MGYTDVLELHRSNKQGDRLLRQPEEQECRGKRLGMIVASYAIFGPPIGGIITIIFGYLTFSIPLLLQSDLSYFLANFNWETFFALLITPVWLLFSSLFGYFFGGLQAITTGFILAYFMSSNYRFSYLTAVLATIPPSIVAGMVLLSDSTSELGFVILLAVVSIAASLILRYLFRKRFSPVYSQRND